MSCGFNNFFEFLIYIMMINTSDRLLALEKQREVLDNTPDIKDLKEYLINLINLEMDDHKEKERYCVEKGRVEYEYAAMHYNAQRVLLGLLAQITSDTRNV